MQKDSGLRIRVERELRDRFLEACRKEDRPAAQVLREFMRKYVDRGEGKDSVGQGPPMKKQTKAAPATQASQSTRSRLLFD